MKNNVLILSGFALNALCLGAVAAYTVANEVDSKAKITARREGLVNIAKHVQADTCWVNSQKDPFKIGDEVSLKGSKTGRIPTSCIKDLSTNQYLLVAYSDSILKVSQVYSSTEVNNQLSMKEE